MIYCLKDRFLTKESGDIMKKNVIMTLGFAFALLLSSCAQKTEAIFIDRAVVQEINIEDEAVALSSSPAAVPESVNKNGAVVAPGIKEKKNSKVIIDYSNTEDGYVMVKFSANTSKKLKSQVKGPKSVYTYTLKQGVWEIFPLSDGNGKYQVSVFENVKDTKYAVAGSVSFDVALKDEFAPHIIPNQYVDYADSVNTIAKAEELTKNIADPLEKVKTVYDYVVKNFTYDKEKAATVKSGYLPVLDTVLEAKKGICFDYAALMTGMLRSQGVPCKLVVGYAGTAYHAWISVWTEKTGWIDATIYFDGEAWHRMDPTFASSAKQSEEIMKYIGDGSNYTEKYIY